jgi:hypothetical protein
MSLLAGLVFGFTQKLVKLVDQLQQLLRVHFGTGLFGKVFPIAGRIGEYWGSFFGSPKVLSLQGLRLCNLAHPERAVYKGPILNKFLDPASFTR